MSKIKVAVEGNPLFVWESDIAGLDHDEAEVRSRLEGTVDQTKFPGATVDDLMHSAVRHVVQNGRLITDHPEMEMTCIVCYLLARPTTHPQHPGRFRDYISVWDFSFDIKPTRDPDDGDFEIKTLGSFELGVVQ